MRRDAHVVAPAALAVIPVLVTALILACAGLTVGVTASARTTLAGPSSMQSTFAAGDVLSMIRAADELYSKRSEPGNVEKSLATLEAVLASAPNHAEAAWRAARSCRWIALYRASSKERPAYLNRAKDLAQRAVDLDSNDPHAYFELGAAIAAIVRESGILHGLFIAGRARYALERAISLGPNHAYAYHELGVLYRTAPGPPVGIGDLDLALANALAAVRLAPDSCVCMLGLAEAYVARKESAKAQETLNRILAMPGLPDEVLENERSKERAMEVLLGLS